MLKNVVFEDNCILEYDENQRAFIKVEGEDKTKICSALLIGDNDKLFLNDDFDFGIFFTLTKEEASITLLGIEIPLKNVNDLWKFSDYMNAVIHNKDVPYCYIRNTRDVTKECEKEARENGIELNPHLMFFEESKLTTEKIGKEFKFTTSKRFYGYVKELNVELPEGSNEIQTYNLNQLQFTYMIRTINMMLLLKHHPVIKHLLNENKKERNKDSFLL